MDDEPDLDDEVCGDTYDHDIVIDHQDPTGIQWHCARPECGVEVWDPTPFTETEES
ncbi:hypothetical protein ABZ401_19540 [Streptomyces sp. NPDC005892]|uniref:hypothetical protein n=1 Tax=Streptomyces sp. NPDC005892 TaxID=3155593 RepID=UPI0033E23ED7